MIVVRLRGGLGNQMFQYAAARRLAWRHGSRVKVDVQSLERSADREYGLDVFRAQPAVAAGNENKVRRKWRDLVKTKTRPNSGVIREADLRFDPTILDLPDGVVLDGYWQSERYFVDAEAVIRQDFGFGEPPSGRNRELAHEIASTPHAISVHVRRGDYVSQPIARRVLGPCEPVYYAEAANYLVTKLQSGTPKLRFFVFSDDPAWVREHLSLPGTATIVDHNGAYSAHEDLRLMKLCRHHVIANSSFSWWGAWLAEGPDKIVVAPRRWFRDSAYSDEDLIPERWIRL